MNRSPLRPWRRPQPELPALNRAISPWFRFEITDDCIEVLDRLVAVGPFSGGVELRASSVRLTGEVTAYARRSPTSWGYSIRHGLTLNDDAGQVHDVDFDEIQALRFRLDHDGSSDVLRATWHSIVDHTPLLGLHLGTGELRTGIAVGFVIDDSVPLMNRQGSFLHVLPVPLEALNTEEIWTMVRLAMYHPARALYDDWIRGWLNSGYLDTYFTAEIRSVAYLEEHDGAIHWNTNVVPAFGLDRPLVERTRLWFVDDVHQPFRRAQVDTTVRHRDDHRYPTSRPAA